eukprot:CAMPEP_0202963070 /NCGR_PEP_ID=MMETSP1396-20130829/7062_1 /ASSEMBLY_ACC=CAM_ASM_000872 /TAXON_ID= /ORGANISM="Pseudokeronopsis sp., Strain Brazil" /LENGTH=410 /DNA_ID=CAMNT_0049683997 /DNA_START=51 /DNA_END=1283 /DNA_ORIENTATION=+
MSQGVPNWLGLLRWSMAVNDGTVPSAFSTMSSADREWLEVVMKDVVRSDPERMNEVMLKVRRLLDLHIGEDQISEDPEVLEEQLQEELEELRDIVEQVDMAQVFCKFGGCELLLQLAEHARVNNLIRSTAVAVIGTVAQNNLAVQDALYKDGIIVRLLALFRLSTSEQKLQLAKKTFFTISSCIRGHAAAEEFFVVSGLQDIAVAALQFPSLQSKLYFLSKALIESDSCNANRISLVCRVLLLSVLNMGESANERAVNNRQDEELDVMESGLLLLKSFLSTSLGQTILFSEEASGNSLQVSQQPNSIATGVSRNAELSYFHRFAESISRWKAVLVDTDPESRAGQVQDQLQELLALVFSDIENPSRNSVKRIPVLFPTQHRIPTLQQETAESSTVLLIAPPPLEAASRAP